MKNVHLCVVIDGREAIPVRAVPFLTNWTGWADIGGRNFFYTVGPDVLVRLLMHCKSIVLYDFIKDKLNKLFAYFLPDGNNVKRLLPVYWDRFPQQFTDTGDRIEKGIILPTEGDMNTIIILPAGVFVWKDEFEEIFIKLTTTYHSPTRAHRGGRYEKVEKKPGTGELMYWQPMKEDLINIVFEGFPTSETTIIANPADQPTEKAVESASQEPAIVDCENGTPPKARGRKPDANIQERPPQQASETSRERQARLQQWYDEEVTSEGERGAYNRVAAREKVSRQRVVQILKHKHKIIN